MRNRTRASLLVVIALLGASTPARAQALIDSATLQIRQTPFAPQLHVNFLFSYQTWSGTFVRELFPGEGLPQGVSSNVRITLRMWLADGTPILDPAQPNDTLGFVVGRGTVIRGLEEGVTGMRLGAVRQLIIPSVAGFGLAGRGTVPPNAVLVAEVKMIGAALSADRLLR